MVSRFLTKSVPAVLHSHGNTTYNKLKHIITTLATMGLILAPDSLFDNNGANASVSVSKELREWGRVSNNREEEQDAEDESQLQ
jgi:hypothetical protein